MSAQYTFPGAKWTLSGGLASAKFINADSFTTTASLAPKYSYGYGSVFFEPLAWLRFGGEYAKFVTTYDDPLNPTATDNRMQLTTYFVF